MPKREHGLIRLDTVDRRWVLHLMLIVLALAIIPVALGILLDRLFHTSPIITLAAMLLGFNLAIFMIARSVGAMYSRIAVPDSQSPSVGGDQ